MLSSHEKLFLILLTALWRQSYSLAIQRAPLVQAGLAQLYSSNLTIMSNQSYWITFQTNFSSLPNAFGFGINQYQAGDKFDVQYVDSFLDSLNTSYAVLNVWILYSTNIYVFSVSYLVAEQTSINTIFYSESNPTNISSGSGDRSYSLEFNNNSSSNSSTAITLLTGFYINTNYFYQVATEAEVLSAATIKVTIKTTSDCFVLRIGICLITFWTNRLKTKGYYFEGGQNVINSTDSTVVSFNQFVTYYQETQFLLGLSGFQGFQSLSGCYWGWQLYNVSFDVGTLQISKCQFQGIYFSFFQFGLYSNSSDSNQTNYTPASSSSSSSPIGIIAGIIIGLVVAVVATILYFKCKSSKSVSNMVPVDDFKELPTLTL